MDSKLGKRKSKALSLYDDDEETESQPVAKKSESIPVPKIEEVAIDSSISLSIGSNVYGLEQKITASMPEGTVQTITDVALLSVLGAKRGERDDMQDAHLLMDKFDIDKTWLNRCALYGIYDGHAGARAAKCCEEYIPEILKRKLSTLCDLASLEKALKRIFTETYKAVDDIFLNKARKEKPVWKDGSTATTVLVLNNSIYVANIGDSRTVVGRRKVNGEAGLSSVQLSIDHNPIVYEERMRIQKAGGVVKNGRVNGIIEVSRSIGDGQFKSHGVICSPDMKKLSITENDEFFIVACDGLWKSFTNDEAVNFVWNRLTPQDKTNKVKWLDIADQLAREAVKKRCGDNVSIILVTLNKIAL